MAVHLLKVIVQPVFVDITDGEATEHVGQPITVNGRDWPTFGASAFGPDDLAAVQAQIDDAAT